MLLVFWGASLVLEWLDMVWVFYVQLLTAGIGVAPILYKALLSIRLLLLDINVLMSLAVIGAILLQQYNDACLVVVLLALAHQFEEYSMMNIRNALKSAAATSG